MGPTQGPYILQLCMGPSNFWRGLTHNDPPLFCTLGGVIAEDTEVELVEDFCSSAIWTVTFQV